MSEGTDCFSLAPLKERNELALIAFPLSGKDTVLNLKEKKKVIITVIVVGVTLTRNG